MRRGQKGQKRPQVPGDGERPLRPVLTVPEPRPRDSKSSGFYV